MHTLDEWKAVLVKDLLELRQLEGQDASIRIRRSLKEQEIGQHCCQAGESLGFSTPYRCTTIGMVSINRFSNWFAVRNIRLRVAH